MKTVAAAAAAVAAVLLATAGVEGKLTQCDVARLATEAGIPEAQIPAMVCTAFYESGWNPTNTGKNKDGSTDFGLWQINDNYWCSYPGFPGKANGCGVACTSLLSALPNAQCAKRILAAQGLKAWYGYTSHKATCDAYKISDSCKGPGGASPKPSPLPSAAPPDPTTNTHSETGSSSGSDPSSTSSNTGSGTGSQTTTGTLTTSSGTGGSTTGSGGSTTGTGTGGSTTGTGGSTTTGGGATTTGGGGSTTGTGGTTTKTA